MRRCCGNPAILTPPHSHPHVSGRRSESAVSPPVWLLHSKGKLFVLDGLTAHSSFCLTLFIMQRKTYWKVMCYTSEIFPHVLLRGWRPRCYSELMRGTLKRVRSVQRCLIYFRVSFICVWKALGWRTPAVVTQIFQIVPFFPFRATLNVYRRSLHIRVQSKTGNVSARSLQGLYLSFFSHKDPLKIFFQTGLPGHCGVCRATLFQLYIM